MAYQKSSVGMAITSQQRDEILGLGLPYGLYPSCMALLILTYWRVKVQPEAIPWLTARGTGGTQHVCKITGKTAQLYDWFRHQYPGCSGRALMSLGLMTFRDLQQQGHGIGSIVEMVQGEEATLWPS